MAFRPFARRHGRGCPVLETAPGRARGFRFCRRKPLCLSCAPPLGPSRVAGIAPAGALSRTWRALPRYISGGFRRLPLFEARRI